ncbi:MAG: TIGR03619 family F420-dependent LLM class oxidoreductase [Gammaproteobacteria bacterium]|nr:TIGR03619 family F420-dependent LLM class oxidoreductase [Gammaproteobacteria bacterium]MCP5200784.1 TIGR03619 family F420-dependent LLM class oxidoreductase [Gammaproteobacteria bacterium]
MRLGMLLRNSGPVATAGFITDCARTLDEAGIDDLYVLDHVAIPPDDAAGSGGRYVDALATLAYVAGVTRCIGLGTAVLVVPYRPALATAKWVAAIQELSGGRLVLGVGAGWMPAEFTASGVPREARGRITDETLAFLHECFAKDVVEAHGQPFIFSPRPPRPPILVGGSGAHVVRRIVAHGDGWIPTVDDPAALAEPVAALAAAMAAASRPAPQVVPLTRLPLDDATAAAARLSAYADAGCTGLIHAARYETVEDCREQAAGLLAARRAAGLAAPA